MQTLAPFAVLAFLILTACAIEPGPGGNGASAVEERPVDVCTGSGPTDAAVATVTASAESTACLIARCTPLPACGQVTPAQPVCVELYSAGGMLLDLYACSADGCCY